MRQMRRSGSIVVKFGAYVTVQMTVRGHEVNDYREVSFFAPPSIEHSDDLFRLAETVARKKWKRCHVTETWRY